MVELIRLHVSTALDKMVSRNGSDGLRCSCLIVMR